MECELSTNDLVNTKENWMGEYSRPNKSDWTAFYLLAKSS